MSLLRSACVIALLCGFMSTTVMAQKPAARSTAKPASLQATLEKVERAGWEAFKNKDEKAYTALCTPDYTGVFADGKPTHDLASAIEAMKAVTVNSYTLSDIKVTPLGANAALVTYNAAVNLTPADGKAQDSKLAVTDVWVKQAGHWKSWRYHESEVK